MKTFPNIALIFFLAVGFCACEKDDTPEIEKLPPATQTGAGTFACLVNGEAFIHNDGLINCFYQYVNGGYYFKIGGQQDDASDVYSVKIGTRKKEIFEGETYLLKTRSIGNGYGSVGIKVGEVDAAFSETNVNYTGEMTITKLDFENHIVSGTFWFNLKHPITGDTIKIRKGRFDSHFGT